MQTTHTLGLEINSEIDNSLRALDRLGSKTKETINDLKKVNQINSKVKTANSRAAKSFDKLEDEINEVSNTSKKMSSSMNNSNQALNKKSKATDKAKTSTDSFISSQSESLAIAVKSISLWGVAAGAVYGFSNQLQNAATFVVELDSRLTELNKVLNVNGEQLDFMKKKAIEMGDEYYSKVDNVIRVQEELARTGKNQQEILELTGTALMSQNISNLKSAESVRMLNAAIKQYNMKASDSLDILDQWNKLSNNSSATIKDLATAVSRAGKSAESAGIGIESLNAIVSSLINSTQRSGSEIGRSLRTIFSRLKSEKFEEAVSEIGISIKKTTGEYRNMMSVLKDLYKVYPSLNDVQREQIALAGAGRRRINIFKNLISDFGSVSKYTEMAINSSNSAIEEQNRMVQQISKQWEKAIVKAQKITATLSDAGVKGVMLSLIKVLQDSLEIINDTINGFDELGVIGKSLIGILGTAGLVKSVIMLTNVIKDLTIAKTALNAVMNPMGLLISGLITGITLYSYKLGQEKKTTQQLINVKKTLNQLRKEGASLTKSEYEAAKEGLGNVQNKMKKLKEATKEYYKAISSSKGAVLDPVAQGEKSTRQLQKLKEELKTLFPELKGTYNPKEIMKELSNIYTELNNKLAKNVAYQSEKAKKVFDEAMTKKEELAQLEYQVDLWKEINTKMKSNEELTSKQEQRYKTISNILKDQFKQLKGLTGNEMSKELNSILNNQTNSTNTMVEDAIKELKGYKKDWTKVLDNLKEEYNKAFNESLNNGMNIRSARIENKDIKERMNRIKSYIESINKQIESLKRNVEYTEFIEGSEEQFKAFKTSITKNLIDPLKKFEDRFKNTAKSFKSSMKALEIKNNLFNLSNDDFNKQMKSILENNINSLIQLKADLNVSNIEKQRKQVLSDVNSALDNGNLNENRRKELEQLKKQINNTKKVKVLNEAINELLSIRKGSLDNINEKLEQESKKTDYSKLIIENMSNKFKRLKEQVDGFDKDKYIGILNPANEIKELDKQKQRLNDLRNILLAQSISGNITEKEFDEWDKKIKEQKKQLSNNIEWLEEKADDVKSKWINAFVEATDSFAPGQFDNIGEALESTIKDTLRKAFNDKDMRKNLNDMFDDLGKMLSDNKKMQKSLSSGLMAATETAVNGASAGKTLLTGAGAAIGSAFGSPQLGAAVGSMIGGIGESLFGGQEGEGKLAGELKKQVAQAKDYLEDYGLDDLIASVKTRDDAGFFQSAFGGSDISILNKEAVIEDLEELYPRLKDTINNIGNGLSNALMNATNFNDYKKAFDNTIGSALEQSMADAIMKSAMVKSSIGRLTQVITQITSDGILESGEMRKFETILAQTSTMKKNAYEMMQTLKTADGFQDLMSDNEVNNTTQQSFIAGSSSTYNFSNTYVVKSEAFAGSKMEAKLFARKITPYVEEQMNRVN